jgi:hypothetical protein
MSTKLTLGLDTNHNVTYELPVSNVIIGFSLVANSATTITIPANMTRAFFSFAVGTDVIVDYSTTASIPGTSPLSRTSELNPVGRYKLKPGNTLSFISPTTSYVYVSFFTDNINGAN